MHLTLGGDTLRRITKAALGGLAGCALVLGGTQVASGALSDNPQELHERLVTTVLTSDCEPFDSAKAKITIDEGTDDSHHFQHPRDRN